MTNNLDSSLARWAGKTFTRQSAASYARGLAPAVALLFFTSTAHAQGAGGGGSIDFTQATTVFSTIKTFVVGIGALFVVMGLVFAAVRMMGGRMAEGAMGIAAALIGGLVIGLGPGWINQLSGQVTQ